MSLTGNSHSILSRSPRISRAPPHHTLPAFLNLHGMKNIFFVNTIFYQHKMDFLLHLIQFEYFQYLNNK